MMLGEVVFGALLLIGGVSSQLDTPQEVVDYLSNNLQLQFEITTNFESVGNAARSRGTISFINNGDIHVTDTTWEIYFCSIRIFEPDTLRDNPTVGKMLGNSNLKVYHVNGCLHKIRPTATFVGFRADDMITAPYEVSDWQASRTDVSPNWYVTAANAEPRTLLSTAGESLDFVGDFTTPEQWKRRDYDEYDPYTPEVRYDRNADVEDNGDVQLPIIPTPVDFYKNSDAVVDIAGADWVVAAKDIDSVPAAMYLADKLRLQFVEKDRQPSSRYIECSIGNVQDRDGGQVTNVEAYRIDIKVNNEIIDVVGKTAAGLFHGVNSVWSLYDYSTELPDVTVVDYPRFPYRGMEVDVGRNFQTKESILKLLEVMGMYKMNKFHFHLTDDEAWRLEIPGLDELTQIGAYRCHDLEETTCIIPQLGSGPGISNSGSGFYSVEEYKEILQYAQDRGIEVIPEFDMPGHGHAAIKSMEARYHSLKDTDPDAASQYLLSDLNDTSVYLSIQYFRDNAINPCLQSSEDFVRKIAQEVKAMHADIQPLKIFHFGGDEVPHGAWENSPACDGSSTPDELMENFIYTVAGIINDEGLDLAGWEDGLMKDAQNAYDRTLMPNNEVYGYAWNNIWEWGGGSRAYILANEDYRVVLSHATDLYFDMPYEPDPEERGFYWATRFTETRNTFNYIPDSIFDNIEVDLFGRPLTKEDVCNAQECVVLEEGKRQNVVGIQGQLWSETVKTEEHFQFMVFPRILSIAERSWHKASWEELLNDKAERIRQRNENWEEFANTLGYKELLRLDNAGVSYRVPLPGAKISEEDGVLSANCNIPGLTIQHSVDGGVTWTDYKDGQQMPSDVDVQIRTRSADMSRTSRVVTMRSPKWDDGAAATMSHMTLYALCLIAVLLYGLF